MAFTTRKITGPIEDQTGTGIELGYLRVRLLYLAVTDEDIAVPGVVERQIVDGNIQEDLVLVTPGLYEITILNLIRESLWSFRVDIPYNDGSDVSIGKLFSDFRT